MRDYKHKRVVKPQLSVYFY
uniref:Uncharacterized protein n=1 Tax=Rhizophora mucronata TaxID=61149 RepID=A0A2P2P991_RHIMU